MIARCLFCGERCEPSWYVKGTDLPVCDACARPRLRYLAPGGVRIRPRRPRALFWPSAGAVPGKEPQIPRGKRQEARSSETRAMR